MVYFCLGYEIDSEEAYRNQIDTFYKAFSLYLNKVVEFLKDLLKDHVKEAIDFGLKHWLNGLNIYGVEVRVVVNLTIITSGNCPEI